MTRTQGPVRVMWREVCGSRRNVPVAREFGLGWKIPASLFPGAQRPEARDSVMQRSHNEEVCEEQSLCVSAASSETLDEER